MALLTTSPHHITDESEKFREKRMRGSYIILMTVLMSIVLPNAEAERLSKREMLQLSDLSIDGKVMEVTKSGRMGTYFGHEWKIDYAKVEILRIIKGNAKSPIIVEFYEANPNNEIEGDVYPRQLMVGEKKEMQLRIMANDHYMLL